MRQLGLRCAVCAYVFSVVSSLSHAEPVTYKEVTDGDLPHNEETPSYFVLDVGTNVFTGTSRWAFLSDIPSVETDRDDIAFTVPKGMFLESISYSIDYKGESGTVDGFGYALYPGIAGYGTQFGREWITVPTNRGSLFQQSLPLYSGDYLLSHGVYKHYLKPNEYRDFEYTWELTLSTIPSENAQARAVVVKAQEAYKNGDYETVLQKARPLAEQGNADAQTLLGNMYHQGRGVSQDYTLAVKWYMKAYRQGDVYAKYWVELLHKKGRSIYCNPVEFDQIVLPLAREGYAPAQDSVCTSYATGSCGLPQDFQKAREWCEKAVELGLSEAQDSLDRLIPAEEAHTKKLLEEVKHYEQKAAQGDLDAHLKLGMIYYGEDNNKAAHWFKKPAEKGNPDAQARLGMLLAEQGNTNEGLIWLNSSAEQNYILAQYYLGSVYENGMGNIEKDYVSAYMWYWLACTYNENECDSFPFFSGPKNLAKLMPASDIEKAEKLAKRWLDKHMRD